jgi:ABC-type multidrug transport system fused ATPase/permease subunit
MTVVIIAHRLSTVKNSHKICVIKGGQATGEGLIR